MPDPNVYSEDVDVIFRILVRTLRTRVEETFELGLGGISVWMEQGVEGAVVRTLWTEQGVDGYIVPSPVVPSLRPIRSDERIAMLRRA